MNAHHFPMTDAPGGDLLARLRSNADAQTLQLFLNTRAEWNNGRKLIHDRFVTYGLFDDLTCLLDAEERFRLIPLAATLACTVPDAYFCCALALLGALLPDDRSIPRPPRFSDDLLFMRLRCERLGFLPNIESLWMQVATLQRGLVDADDRLRQFTPEQLRLVKPQTKPHFPQPLPDYIKGRLQGIKLDWSAWRSLLRRAGSLPGEQRLIYSTRIDASRYLVWRLPGKPNTAHIMRLVYLRQTPDEQSWVGYWDLYRQFVERDSASEITRRLLRIEFTPRPGVLLAQAGGMFGGEA